MRLAVIPARGGSKRIPRKNIKLFCGKPMIARSIDAAIQSQCFDRIIVSTDDAEIAEIAVNYGAEVPFLRPVSLADDHTETAPVIAHAIDWFIGQGQVPTEVCCIYATAPFISSKDIRAGLITILETGSNYVFPVTSYPSPIQRAVRLKTGQHVEMFSPEFFHVRSQDLEDAYHDAGQFYWGLVEAWRQRLPIFSSDATAIVLPRYRVQDIDTEEDWDMAERMFEAFQQSTYL